MKKRVAANKVTSPKVAKKASSNLKSSKTGKATKSASGSALAQAKTKKVTSAKAATAASKVLRDGRTGNKSKSAAASALSQKPKKKK